MAHDLEPAMVPAQLLQGRHHRVEVVDAADDLSERGDELVALVGHADREHVTDIRVGQEQRRIEEQRNLVAVRRHRAPVVLEPLGVDHAQLPVLSLSTMSGFTLVTTAPAAARASSSAPRSTSTLTRCATTLS